MGAGVVEKVVRMGLLVPDCTVHSSTVIIMTLVALCLLPSSCLEYRIVYLVGHQLHRIACCIAHADFACVAYSFTPFSVQMFLSINMDYVDLTNRASRFPFHLPLPRYIRNSINFWPAGVSGK